MANLGSILDPRLDIAQGEKTHRYGIEAVLLAFYVRCSKPHHKANLLDLGCGSGVLTFLLHYRFPKLKSLVGIDIQEEAIAICHENLRRNSWCDGNQLTFQRADWRHSRSTVRKGHGAFSLVVSNPPWFETQSGRPNENAGKNQARHAAREDLADWAKAAAYFLKTGGRFYSLFTAARLAELSAVLDENDLALKRLRFVHGHPQAPAKFMLFEASRSGKRALRVERPLFVYAQPGRYSEDLEHLFAEKELLS